jgi:hypothetical protein
MTELPGGPYLLNLSLVAVTVAVVSALVMLVRQTMGGKLSNFDVYLMVTYVSLGFAIAFDAILPSLVSLYEPSAVVLWATSSLVAALLLAGVIANIIKSRLAVAKAPISAAIRVAFAVHCLDAVLLAANGVLPQLQKVSVFATALTISLAMLMWAFVRRIGSLLGDKPGEDWDPKRG